MAKIKEFPTMIITLAIGKHYLEKIPDRQYFLVGYLLTNNLFSI